MKKIMTLLILMVFSCSAFASGFKTEKEIRNFTDKMMDQFLVKKFDEALNSAKSYWPIPSVEVDSMSNQISQQWPIIDQRFGQSISKEFIKEKRIGKSFLRYYYLHKFENHSIYWQFDFYKPRKEWKINSITFLDTLGRLYE